jgi:hypothetical protein
MTDVVIWSGAKWVISGMSAILAQWTIPAAQNQLGKWLEKGWITFHDDPVDPDEPARNQFLRESLLYGGYFANVASYLFAKTLFVNEIFPSLLVFITIQSNLMLIYYEFMNKTVKWLFEYHGHAKVQNYVDAGILSYLTWISVYGAELSKIPLL